MSCQIILACLLNRLLRTRLGWSGTKSDGPETGNRRRSPLRERRNSTAESRRSHRCSSNGLECRNSDSENAEVAVTERTGTCVEMKLSHGRKTLCVQDPGLMASRHLRNADDFGREICDCNDDISLSRLIRHLETCGQIAQVGSRNQIRSKAAASPVRGGHAVQSGKT